MPVIFHKKVKMNDLLAAKDASFTFKRARLEELESKVARLEELESKVTQLEGKVTRLEEKERQQELQIEKLQNEREICSAIGERSMGRSVSFPRTCRELRSSDPTLTSGMHWIDPDGQGVGDDPIYVYCNMATGKYILFQKNFAYVGLL